MHHQAQGLRRLATPSRQVTPQLTLVASLHRYMQSGNPTLVGLAAGMANNVPRASHTRGSAPCGKVSLKVLQQDDAVLLSVNAPAQCTSL